MFYPPLKRNPPYQVKSNGDYYHYSYYKSVIELDCENRCVYCDTIISEAGGEGFHLDHFRPQHFFENLKNDPTNLVISCSKCNLYKGKHWPIPIDDDRSHNGCSGFINPFEEKVSEYFFIENGYIKEVEGVVAYLIRLLNLNRPSRVQIRRKRFLEHKKQELLSKIETKIQLLDEKGKGATASEISALRRLILLFRELQDL